MKGYHLHLKPGDRPTGIAIQKPNFQRFIQQLNLYNQTMNKQPFYPSL